MRVYTIGFGTADPRRRARRCGQQFIGREPPGGGGGFGGGGSAAAGGGGFRRGIDEDDAQGRSPTRPAARTTRPRAPTSSTRSSQNLPTNLITKHEVIEISVGVRRASGRCSSPVAILLGQAWRPLP